MGGHQTTTTGTSMRRGALSSGTVKEQRGHCDLLRAQRHLGKRARMEETLLVTRLHHSQEWRKLYRLHDGYTIRKNGGNLTGCTVTPCARMEETLPVTRLHPPLCKNGGNFTGYTAHTTSACKQEWRKPCRLHRAHARLNLPYCNTRIWPY